MGAILKKGNEYFGLSNNHVLAGFNYFAKGKPFTMPAPMDMDQKNATVYTVGELSEIFPISFGNSDFVSTKNIDAALVKIADISRHSSSQGGKYDTPKVVGTPKQDIVVKKFGRSTGLTLGTIRGFVPVRALSTRDKNIPYFLCDDMWEIEPNLSSNLLFSSPGDSGSLVVSEDGKEALGIVVSGSKKGTTFMIGMEAILKFFDCTLVSGI